MHERMGAAASSSAARQALKSDADLYELARSYAEVHLFLGYGERAQYADVEEVLAALDPHLKQIEARCGKHRWLAVYGGDKAVEARPDLGWLMHRTQQRYACHIVAVQSAGQPDEHVDYHYVAEPQHEVVKRTQPDGTEAEVQEVLYGGTRDGRLVGGTRFYLGKEFVGRSSPSDKRLLTSIFVAGGGGVALQELQYADEQGVPWAYVPSRARHEAAYNSTYGPVHEWVKARLDEGPAAGKKLAIVTANGSS